MANSFRIVSVIAALILVPQHARAQAAPKSLDELIRKAEEAGAVAAKLGEMPAFIPKMFANDQVSGSKERKCSDARATARAPLRSGEFIIGGDLSIDNYLAGSPIKIWWAPLHHRPEMNLVVTGHLAGSIADTLRYESSDVAWPSAPGATIPESERAYFFPSGISFPKAGTWVVTATQGPDWGCFIVHQNGRFGSQLEDL